MKSASIPQAVRLMSKLRKSAATSEQVSGPIYADKNGNTVVQVLAKPGAKANGITGIEDEGVGVQINARPVDGEANTELLKYMMSVLGLKKSEISFEKGMKSRQKVLVISRVDFTPEKVTAILRNEISSKN